MKRILVLAALLCGMISVSSCGLANNLAGTAGRSVQSVMRTAGLSG
jgi:hypothetical protein